VYVNDLNIIRTPIEIANIVNYLKKELKMKDLRKIKFYLGLHIKHLVKRILIH
jgi:hypothetical protein